MKKKKEIEEMAKQIVEKKARDKVRFVLGPDGLNPSRQAPGGVFNIRAPLSLIIPSHTDVLVRTDVSCNYPLHVFEAGGLKDRGQRLSDAVAGLTVDANYEIVLKIENTTQGTLFLERGETIARAYVLDSNDIEVL